MTLVATLLFLVTFGATAYGLFAALSATNADIRKQTEAMDALFAAVALAVCATGLLAMPLVQLGIFSLLGLSALLAVVAALSIWWAQRHGPRLRLEVSPIPRLEWLVLGGLLLASVVLFFRPHETILGGADAGVYISLGVHMAESGGLLIHEPGLAQLDPANAPALLRALPPWEHVRFLRFPGFYVDDARPEQVIPQFYTLHPLWIAIAYSIGHMTGALLMTPVWGVLAIWAVYMVGRQLLGPRAAWLPALLVLLTPLQLYFARYPTAEPIAQYFAWLGVWAFTYFTGATAPRRLWGLLAALALGSMFLARIDMIFMLLLPATWALYLLLARRWSTDEWWFWIPLAISGAYAGFHALVFSGPYTLATYATVFAFLRTQLWIVAVTAGVSGALLFYAAATQRARLTAWAAHTAHARWPRHMLAAGLIALSVYGYFLRPLLGETIFAPYWYSGTEIPLTDHLNLVRLGWYLGPLGLVLAVAGGVLAAETAPWRTVWPLWLVGGSFTLFFLFNVLNNPFHIYGFRRYVPVAVPFFQLGAGYALLWLWRRGSPSVVRRTAWQFVASLLGIALVATLLYNSRLIGRQVDDAGGTAQLAQLADRFDKGAILLFVDPAPVGIGAIFGTPLQYLYEFTAFDLQEDAVYPERLASQARAWEAEGHPVYVVARRGSDPATVVPEDASLADQGEYVWQTIRLEQSYEHMPATVVPVDYAMTIYRWMQPEP